MLTSTRVKREAERTKIFKKMKQLGQRDDVLADAGDISDLTPDNMKSSRHHGRYEIHRNTSPKTIVGELDRVQNFLENSSAAVSSPEINLHPKLNLFIFATFLLNARNFQQYAVM